MIIRWKSGTTYEDSSKARFWLVVKNKYSKMGRAATCYSRNRITISCQKVWPKAYMVKNHSKIWANAKFTMNCWWQSQETTAGWARCRNGFIRRRNSVITQNTRWGIQKGWGRRTWTRILLTLRTWERRTRNYAESKMGSETIRRSICLLSCWKLRMCEKNWVEKL